MKGGGKAAGIGAAALLVALLLVAAASLHADAAGARRLGAAEVLSGPKPNPCTYDPNNPGKTCNGPGGQYEAAAVQSPPVVTGGGVGLTGPKPNPCTHDPTDPTGKKCLHPPTAP